MRRGPIDYLLPGYSRNPVQVRGAACKNNVRSVSATKDEYMSVNCDSWYCVLSREQKCVGGHHSCSLHQVLYRGTSLIRKRPLPRSTVGPGPGHRPTVGSSGGAFSYERGTPVAALTCWVATERHWSNDVRTGSWTGPPGVKGLQG